MRLIIIAMLLFAAACSTATPQLETDSAAHVSDELIDLLREYQEYLDSEKPIGDFEPSQPGLRVDDGFVLVDATSDTTASELLGAELKLLGFRDGTAVGRVVSGWLPIRAIDELKSLNHLKLVRAAAMATGGGAPEG